MMSKERKGRARVAGWTEDIQTEPMRIPGMTIVNGLADGVGIQ
jgi:hypothetical protein